jgi:hypothetical protein
MMVAAAAVFIIRGAFDAGPRCPRESLLLIIVNAIVTLTTIAVT